MSERDEVGKEFLRSARSRLGSLKALGDEALTRLDDAELTKTLDPESNSVAVLVQHIAGNMRSRWTDFLTTDGEKPDRHRDAEFEPGLTTKAPLIKRWEDGWPVLFAALDAINRQLVHYGQHVGQVVYLAKHFKWQTWKSLSVPRRRPPAKG